MRTTLSIDDDILEAAKDLARRENRSIGEVLSNLARRALTGSTSYPHESTEKPFHGFRVIPRQSDRVVSNELIDRLREDDVY